MVNLHIMLRLRRKWLWILNLTLIQVGCMGKLFSFLLPVHLENNFFDNHYTCTSSLSPFLLLVWKFDNLAYKYFKQWKSKLVTYRSWNYFLSKTQVVQRFGDLIFPRPFYLFPGSLLSFGKARLQDRWGLTVVCLIIFNFCNVKTAYLESHSQKYQMEAIWMVEFSWNIWFF